MTWLRARTSSSGWASVPRSFGAENLNKAIFDFDNRDPGGSCHESWKPAPSTSWTTCHCVVFLHASSAEDLKAPCKKGCRRRP